MTHINSANGEEMRAFCQEVASYVAASMPSDPPPPPPKRKVLGLEIGAWMKLLLGWTLAVVTFVFTWYNTVNASLEDLKARPTLEQIEKVIHDDINHHTNEGAHPEAQRRLENLEKEQRVIRHSQIRQETIDTQQTETLREIRDDVKRLRRQR